MKECLRGDAADVEAGATESSTLLDAGGFESQLSCFDGCHVSTGSATDDDDVVVIRSGGGETPIE
jgi:hypothetical protein